jgi:NurA domain
MDFEFSTFPPNGQLVTKVEEIDRYKMNPKKGQDIINKYPLYAYDESIYKYQALQGEAYFTSHSLIKHGENDYIPANLLTFYFYTRSKNIEENSSYIKDISDSKYQMKIDYFDDRIEFLLENIEENSILFIDGPLIGGDQYVKMIHAIKDFLGKNILPIFFVKNSDSNLVTDNIDSLKGKFNSDLHWSYSLLKPGERTNFFKYVDKVESSNAKIFCYLKGFDVSPQRIEFPLNAYEQFKNIIPEMMDLVYYLLLVQGDLKNPQLRPIAIAEKYARSTLGLIDIRGLMRKSLLTPTMNQERFER